MIDTSTFPFWDCADNLLRVMLSSSSLDGFNLIIIAIGLGLILSYGIRFSVLNVLQNTQNKNKNKKMYKKKSALSFSVAYGYVSTLLGKLTMATFCILAAPFVLLDPTSSSAFKRKGKRGSKTNNGTFGFEIRMLIAGVGMIFLGGITIALGSDGADIGMEDQDNTAIGESFTVSENIKHLEDISRKQLRGNMDPSDAISQNKVILDSLLEHMQSLQKQVESGGETSIALLLESVIVDAQAAADLMSGEEPIYAIKDDKLDALALQDSIKDMTSPQVDSVAQEFASKLKELIKNTHDALNMVKEAELSISNVDDARYHRRATTTGEEWNEGDFEFGQSRGDGGDRAGWKAFKASSGFSIPRSPKLSKYGKRDYVELPKLKLADELRKKAGNQGNRRLLQDREECQPACDIENFDCNCGRLFECVNSLSLYDLATLTVGGFVDEDPNSDFFATFGENGLSNMNLFEFDVQQRLETIRPRLQDVNKENCDYVLSLLYTACEPGDTCTEPNTRSFYLSTEQVCSAVNIRTKLKVNSIGDLYDFQNEAIRIPRTHVENVAFHSNLFVLCCKDGEEEDDKWHFLPSAPSWCPLTLKIDDDDVPFLAYPDAELFCSEEGGRICTRDELQGKCATHGLIIDGLNYGLTWSSTRAEPICPLESADVCGEFAMSLDSIYSTLGEETSLPLPQAITVFVSSETYSGGEVGGIEGANRECQILADNASLTTNGEVYEAWIATNAGGGPIFNFESPGFSSIQLVDGTIIAHDWSTLLDRGRELAGEDALLSPLNMDETGKVVTGGNVWTNTPPRFSFAPVPDCEEWTSSANGREGNIGRTDETSYKWSELRSPIPCNQKAHLYCFQQIDGNLVNPMRKNSAQPVQPDLTNVQFPDDFIRYDGPTGIEYILGYDYQPLSSDTNDLFCGAEIGPPLELARACDKSMDFLLGNEMSIGSLTSISRSVAEVPEQKFIPKWVPWYTSLVDTPVIERNYTFFDYYLNITNPMNDPQWLSWYLSLRDDDGFVLPNPNGGTFFCNDQEILNDPLSTATLRNCQETWLYDTSGNPYTSKYEAISYPDNPDLLPFNETSCDAFPTCHLEWLDTSTNPFSDGGTSGADVYANVNVCGVDSFDAERNCETNQACPGGDISECPEGEGCYFVPCSGSTQPQQQPTNKPTMISTTTVPTPDINKEGCGLFFDYCRQLDPQLNQCQRFWDACRDELDASYPYWQFPLPNCTDQSISQDVIITCPIDWLNITDNPYTAEENESCYYFFDTCREDISTLANYTEYPLGYCEGNSSLTCKEEWLGMEVSPYSEDSEDPDPACDGFWQYCRDQLILEYPRWYWPLPGIPTSAELMPGYCCRDVPRNERYFGYTYNPDRGMICQKRGPLHTWLSPEACSNANGQWFRNPCSTLQRCIADRPAKGDPDFNEQFEQWVLDEELDIYNINDQEQCSQTRVALGYEETHLDDGAVCETFQEYKCDPFFDDLAFLADGASDGNKKFVQVVYTPKEYDDDKPLIFEPLPINDGWLIPEVLTPEESEHIRALAKSQTALAIAYENYKALYDHVHELNKNKCLFIPDFLTLPTPFGGFPIPNPTYIICQNLNFFQKVLAKIVVQVLKGSLWAVTTALNALAVDDVEEIDQNLYIETIYENLKSSDEWTYLALETINQNLNDQHFQMRKELQDRHTDIMNDVNQYTNCMSNFLGIQIYDALEGVTPGRLSTRCEELLGVNSNRRLSEQQDDLPFTLEVVFGPNSFPRQISQVLVKETEIEEIQHVIMATGEEILFDVGLIQGQANKMHSNQQVMMKALSDIQKELDITRKDSKSKKSKKAKAEKEEDPQEDSDIFNRSLLHGDGSVIGASVKQIKTDVERLRSQVGKIEGKVDKMEKSMEDIKDTVESVDGEVTALKSKVDKMEMSIEDIEGKVDKIQDMLEQLLMRGVAA